MGAGRDHQQLAYRLFEYLVLAILADVNYRLRDQCSREARGTLAALVAVVSEDVLAPAFVRLKCGEGHCVRYHSLTRV